MKLIFFRRIGSIHWSHIIFENLDSDLYWSLYLFNFKWHVSLETRMRESIPTISVSLKNVFIFIFSALASPLHACCFFGKIILGQAIQFFFHYFQTGLLGCNLSISLYTRLQAGWKVLQRLLPVSSCVLKILDFPGFISISFLSFGCLLSS